MEASYTVGGARSFFGVFQKNGVAYLTISPSVKAFPTLRLCVRNVSMPLQADLRDQ
jgi:hypothetical protein